MCAKQVKTKPGEIETTGHSWDGIEEYNNPLPRWWLWTFYLTIIWSIGTRSSSGATLRFTPKGSRRPLSPITPLEI